MTFPFILTLTYSFETLLSRDVNTPRRYYVNIEGGEVKDLPFKPKLDLLFETLLLSRDVNSPTFSYIILVCQ